MVNVGKYTSPMDPMGIIPAILLITNSYHRKIMGVDRPDRTHGIVMG